MLIDNNNYLYFYKSTELHTLQFAYTHICIHIPTCTYLSALVLLTIRIANESTMGPNFIIIMSVLL